jgi:hypothetical protein
MAGIGSKVNRDVRVMGSTPCKIVSDAVMGSRMKKHVDLSIAKLTQVTGNENVVGNLRCKPLQIVPRMASSKGRPVETGAKVPAREYPVSAGL